MNKKCPEYNMMWKLSDSHHVTVDIKLYSLDSHSMFINFDVIVPLIKLVY